MISSIKGATDWSQCTVERVLLVSLDIKVATSIQFDIEISQIVNNLFYSGWFFHPMNPYPFMVTFQ